MKSWILWMRYTVYTKLTVSVFWLVTWPFNKNMVSYGASNETDGIKSRAYARISRLLYRANFRARVWSLNLVMNPPIRCLLICLAELMTKSRWVAVLNLFEKWEKYFKNLIRFILECVHVIDHVTTTDQLRI